MRQRETFRACCASVKGDARLQKPVRHDICESRLSVPLWQPIWHSPMQLLLALALETCWVCAQGRGWGENPPTKFPWAAFTQTAAFLDKTLGSRTILGHAGTAQVHFLLFGPKSKGPGVEQRKFAAGTAINEVSSRKKKKKKKQNNKK